MALLIYVCIVVAWYNLIGVVFVLVLGLVVGFLMLFDMKEEASDGIWEEGIICTREGRETGFWEGQGEGGMTSVRVDVES